MFLPSGVIVRETFIYKEGRRISNMVSFRVIEFSKLKCACNFILTEPLPGRLCLDYLYACRDRSRSSIVYKYILLIFKNKADTVNRDRSYRVVTFFI